MDKRITGLYDMAGFEKKDNNMIIQEQRLAKAIKDNMKNYKTNKEIFDEMDNCFTKCPRYDPCPICNKCKNKASHLYVKCEVCQIPICVHKYKDKEFMIRRDNFKIPVSKETINKIKKVEEEVCNTEKSQS